MILYPFRSALLSELEFHENICKLKISLSDGKIIYPHAGYVNFFYLSRLAPLDDQACLPGTIMGMLYPDF
ncbi:MAG: hypothetical protein CVU55_05525 [Deltaproteobacteria bacterium HGW-Deltaproteobacteria-13]|jgi:hypothetical protein|nr:MAG: hypothetical protein CVU55_05525 [Deltaproteobacteria bacterium HGW-Deltaproteobacteria-13]